MATQRLANESVLEAKNVMMLPRSMFTNQEPSIQPSTPDFKRESGEQGDKLSNPIVLVSDSSLNGYPSPSDDGSVTPKGCVFDPFAPGPDKFMLAPLRRKYTEECRPSAVRQLSFPLAINLGTRLDANIDKSDLFESLYHNILDVIVSEQSKECVDGVLTEVLDSDLDGDGFKTPKSAPRLRWIAETCPGAPLRPSSKCRNIDKELCRKLEY